MIIVIDENEASINNNSFVFSNMNSLTPWEKFQNGISQYELYAETDSNVDLMLQNIVSQPIVDVGELLPCMICRLSTYESMHKCTHLCVCGYIYPWI